MSAEISTSTFDKTLYEDELKEYNIKTLSPVSFRQLQGGILSPSPSILKEREFYTQFQESQWRLFNIREDMSFQEFVAVGPEMVAEQVNSLMYFVAPEKLFDLDTRDIRDDWTTLYEDVSQDGLARKARHQALPGWKEYFEAGGTKDRILGLIKRDWDLGKFKNANQNDSIRPVLRWIRNNDGTLNIKLDQLSREQWAALGVADGVLASYDFERIDTPLGAVAVAAYSSGITSEWPRKVNYHGIDYNGSNNNGPTQIIPYVIWFSSDFQNSPILIAMDRFTTMGTLPDEQFPIEVAKTKNSDDKFNTDKELLLNTFKVDTLNNKKLLENESDTFLDEKTVQNFNNKYNKLLPEIKEILKYEE